MSHSFWCNKIPLTNCSYLPLLFIYIYWFSFVIFIHSLFISYFFPCALSLPRVTFLMMEPDSINPLHLNLLFSRFSFYKFISICYIYSSRVRLFLLSLPVSSSSSTFLEIRQDSINQLQSSLFSLAFLYTLYLQFVTLIIPLFIFFSFPCVLPLSSAPFSKLKVPQSNSNLFIFPIS